MRMVDWPRYVPPAAYGRVRDAYVDRLFASGDVRAVYQMGSVGAPGLSDLDLVVVCRDRVARELDALADLRALDAESRYVLMHSQFFVNEEAFRWQRALFLGSDLRHLRGESLPVEEPRPGPREALCLAFHLEMMTRRLVDFERARRGDVPVVVRPLLAALHTLRFNVEAARAWADVSDLEPFARDVRLLRARWFDLAPEEAGAGVRELLDRGAGVILSLLERLRGAAARLHGTPPARGEVRMLEANEVHRYRHGGPAVRLRSNLLAAPFPRRLRETRRLRPHVAAIAEVDLPAEYFAFAALEARALRALGAGHLARAVIGDVQGESAPALAEAMELRARAVLGLRSFLLRNRLRHAACLFPAGWRRPYPWRYRVKAHVLRVAGAI